jgi:hypothetical protein
MPSLMHTRPDKPQLTPGFALVVTLSLMILLTMVAVGLLSLSAISLRSSSQGSAQAEARANARLALMLAIGELQKEMGPDMRVSAESALFDSNFQTESIDGLAQSRWLASYNAWGDWLNASYSPPDSGGSLTIGDTYTDRRDKMFRRWLLSMPPNSEKSITAPNSLTNWNDTNSVILVGTGSLGNAATPDQLTRAYLTRIGTSGKNAWWIGPENHKARIDMAKRTRSLAVDEWQTAQGNTAEVGVGGLAGFQKIDTDAALATKLITTQTLRPAEVAETDVQKHFFDLTAHSKGVLSSVRTGHLKKDLSLLFERSASSLPAPYRFNPGRDIVEPSIRPMSKDLTDKNARIPNRQFASWTNMLHYYRMYRSGGGATPSDMGKNGWITWNRSKPTTDHTVPSLGTVSNPSWDGSNHYWRAPILAQLTLIYSLATQPSPTQDRFYCMQYYTPVFTFWNPYNVELVMPSGQMQIASKPYQLWPTNQKFFVNGVLRAQNGYSEATNFWATISSGGAGDIVFKPGEFRVFSLRQKGTSTQLAGAELLPGFDPGAVAGDERNWGGTNNPVTFVASDNPAAAYEFSSAQWGGGVNYGNTGGAMILNSGWSSRPSQAIFPMTYSNDWFQRSPRNPDQTFTPITTPGQNARWNFGDRNPQIVAYAQMTIKGLHNYDYPSINWERDWRSRNWIHAPPFYFGSGMYISQDDTMAHTQRLDCPYVVHFGPTTTFGVSQIVGQIGEKAFLGREEQITSAPMLELPTAPVSSLAGFSNMRINPGWVAPAQYLKRGLGASDTYQLKVGRFTGGGSNSERASLYAAETKRVAYQSGITGPGIGNSFMHPMLPRNDIYRYVDNSKSQDTPNRENPSVTETVDTMAYCDYWDHVFLLNDALWDDYFVSSLADQSRPGASAAVSLSQNLDRFLAGEDISNTRYRFHSNGTPSTAVKTELQAADGYLKAAKHLMVDGMFNVNSTSVAAWQALFAGIRERQLVYRNNSGAVRQIEIPSGKRIALSRFDTEVSDREMDDPLRGTTMADGSNGWSGVRFLDDSQLKKLAEECVKQVKQRGPFLNFSEFINRRLSDDSLGLMGALQSAIDYDDANPDSKSINYRYKQAPGFMLKKSELGRNSFLTPDAAEGSRLAGIPGYIIQSDLLRPIANTLSVRDDTFRIRAYGEALDVGGKVIARAWCEAVVQRLPEYQDSVNEAEVPARLMNASGTFSDNPSITPANLRFGRKFHIESFRWLGAAEV